MELRDIEIFLMHVSVARVSQAIKKQERRIGAGLFERTSRQVRLTPLGRQLRDDLLPGYQQIQSAIAKATAAGRGCADCCGHASRISD